jgi:hypothetical protein
VPKTIKEALDKDRKIGKTFWDNAIAKEMKEVRITYNILLMENACAVLRHNSNIYHNNGGNERAF